MARKSIKKKSKLRARKRLPFLWSLFLLIVFIGILFWQREVLGNALIFVLEQLGWGLLLILVAICTIVVLLWQKKLSTILYHWNKLLGSIVLIFVVWGILAFFPGTGILLQVGLGGNFGQNLIGQNIIGYPIFLSILRILGLFLLVILLIAPEASLHTITKFYSWLRRQLRKKPGPVKEKPQYSFHTTSTRPVETKEKTQSITAIPTHPIKELEIRKIEKKADTTTAAPQELRQVAQEVWKKYGESSSLAIVDGWRLPPIDILDTSPEVEFGQADNVQRAGLIEDALGSYGVDAKVVQINAGPTVTQFGVEPGWDRKTKEIKEKDKDGNINVKVEEISKTRVKVDRITSLSNDLALALAAPSIRIEAPVPGKSIVGIEVPNTVSSVVSLRGVIETSVFQKIEAKSKLGIALGKGAGGEAVAGDLAKMPHLLIAGATGSGKTVCLNSVICCLLLHNTPYSLKFIMIDPKRVELTPFNSIPHLANPVIVDTSKALSSLRWLNMEMDKRYQQLAAAGSRNIESYNKNKHGEERLSYLVLIIDELADLMMAGFDEVERILCRLAQLARAVGIHLIVATQRPSVDVVTGLIKANFPTRISFAVTSQIDSRTILDIGGAEKLLGGGDMLYMPTEAAKPKRLQGCYVSDNETERLVYFWGNQRKEEMASLNIEDITSMVGSRGRLGIPLDPLLETARQLLKEHKQISTSYLQRKLSIGYPRAARIKEHLKEEQSKVEDEEGERDE